MGILLICPKLREALTGVKHFLELCWEDTVRVVADHAASP